VHVVSSLNTPDDGPLSRDERGHPEFTVGSALRWLGHEVWFLLSGQRSYAFPPKIRVLVDLSLEGVDLAAIMKAG
jgi:hypothetical protein